MIDINNGIISKRYNETTERIDYYLSIECENEEEQLSLFSHFNKNKENLEIRINNIFTYNFITEYTLLDITTREDLLVNNYQVIVQFFKINDFVGKEIKNG